MDKNGKSRHSVWLSDEVWQEVDAFYKLDNCPTRNEFVEKALQFYCDYVASQDCFSVLPPMLVAAIRATVQNSESHICRLLFKLAVEIAIVQNLIAATQDIDPVSLERLRGECVKEVKRLNGGFSFEDALTWQKG